MRPDRRFGKLGQIEGIGAERLQPYAELARLQQSHELLGLSQNARHKARADEALPLSNHQLLLIEDRVVALVSGGEQVEIQISLVDRAAVAPGARREIDSVKHTA